MKKKELNRRIESIARFANHIKEGETLEQNYDPVVLDIKRDGFSGSEVSRKTRPFAWTDLKYHTSYDWLIPVCKKFRAIDITPLINDEDYIISNQLSIYNNRIVNAIADYEEKPIEAFIAMSDAIEWYTSIKKK